jgi:GAF domain-containing protein
MSDGARLGTPYVIERTPRTLSAAHRQTLEMLARQVVGQLELRRAFSELARWRARERQDKDAMLTARIDHRGYLLLRDGLRGA